MFLFILSFYCEGLAIDFLWEVSSQAVPTNASAEDTIFSLLQSLATELRHKMMTILWII